MRYLLKETSAGLINGSLDLASSILLGEIDTDTSTVTGACILSIDTEFIPSNSNMIKIIQSYSDFDKNVFIKTADKFDKGNLLLSVIPSATLSLSNSLTEFRKICSDVTGIQVIVNQSGAVTTSNTFIVVYGFLKETQTLDYNPADEINPALLVDFTMLNPNDLGLS